MPRPPCYVIALLVLDLVLNVLDGIFHRADDTLTLAFGLIYLTLGGDFLVASFVAVRLFGAALHFVDFALHFVAQTTHRRFPSRLEGPDCSSEDKNCPEHSASNIRATYARAKCTYSKASSMAGGEDLRMVSVFYDYVRGNCSAKMSVMENIIVIRQEQQRGLVIAEVDRGVLSVGEGAAVLGVSAR